VTILDPGPQLAGAELTPNEQALAARIDAKRSTNLDEVAAALVAAFLLYRVYMKRRLTEVMKDQEPTQSNLELAMGSVYTAFVPRLVRVFAPHLVAGYLVGVQEARAGSIDNAFLQDIAEGYAIHLGEHLNEVSMEAAVQGYTRQVNRRVPARRAVQNVIEAYGVPNRTMNSLVNVWTGEDSKVLSSMPAQSRRDARAAAIIDAALKQRAHAVGDTEAWAARGQAKQLVWMYAVQKGTFPEGTTKIWQTARDERVCPVCGPMHHSEVALDEPFVTDAGKVWSPPMHPNCRCDVHLSISIDAFHPIFEQELVDKSLGDDPYDRDRRGRFARAETRTKKIEPIVLPGWKLTPVEVEQTEGKIQNAGKIQAEGKIKNTAKIQNLTKITIANKIDPEQEKIEGKKVSGYKVTARKVAGALSTQKVRIPEPDPKDLGEGHFALPEPLWGFMGTAEQAGVGDILLADDETPFLTQNAIENALDAHWHSEVADEVDAFINGESAVDPYYYVGDKRYRVPYEAYESALWWTLSGGRPEMHEIETYNQYTDQIEYAQISDETLSQYFKLEDWKSWVMPTIMITTVGTYGKTDIHATKNHMSARNPGKWVVTPVPKDSVWVKDIDIPANIVFAEPEALQKKERDY